MQFHDAFPTLTFGKKLTDLLQFVTVDRIAINQAKNRLKVYLTSPNWMKKQYLYQIRDAIKEQIFAETDMEIVIVEHFELSSSYTPEIFYKLYRPSMLLELKTQSPLLHQLLLTAEVEFGPEEAKVKVPGSLLAEERSGDLMEYLDKVFRQRAGFEQTDFSLEIQEPVQLSLFEDGEQEIRERVLETLREA